MTATSTPTGRLRRPRRLLAALLLGLALAVSAAPAAFAERITTVSPAEGASARYGGWWNFDFTTETGADGCSDCINIVVSDSRGREVGRTVQDWKDFGQHWSILSPELPPLPVGNYS